MPNPAAQLEYLLSLAFIVDITAALGWKDLTSLWNDCIGKSGEGKTSAVPETALCMSLIHIFSSLGPLPEYCRLALSVHKLHLELEPL